MYAWIALMIGMVFVLALIGALVIVGAALSRNRKGKKETPVSPDEAVEITSTWNMLNH